jgi:hypothetical protein
MPVNPPMVVLVGVPLTATEVANGTMMNNSTDTELATLPAKSLAFRVTDQWPVGMPVTDTVYVTLWPGLLVPVIVTADDAIAVPL